MAPLTEVSAPAPSNALSSFWQEVRPFRLRTPTRCRTAILLTRPSASPSPALQPWGPLALANLLMHILHAFVSQECSRQQYHAPPSAPHPRFRSHCGGRRVHTSPSRFTSVLTFVQKEIRRNHSIAALIAANNGLETIALPDGLMSFASSSGFSPVCLHR